MDLTPEQLDTARHGACFALRFLVDEECRQNARKQMVGFSDAAIFHRRMGLTWALDEPDVLAVLSPEERTKASALKATFDALPWIPIDTHPSISDLPEETEELAKLIPEAKELLELLQIRISLGKE